MTDLPASRASQHQDVDLVVIHKPAYGRWIASLVILALIARLAWSVSTNPAFQWSVVGDYLFSVLVLKGLLLTVELTVIAMVVGILLGLVLAFMRLSNSPLISGSSWTFVWFFRGVPVLVQLIFWYNVSALYPALELNLPFVGTLAQVDANTYVTPLVAATLGLGLNEGAYMSEIIRGALLSVEHGQTEAAYSLGISKLRTLMSIVLPQAMPTLIPPTGNQVINMLKVTSLVSVLSLGELLFSVQTVYTRTFQVIPLLIVASIWYLVSTSVLSMFQFYVERRYSRGSSRALPPTPLQRARRLLASTIARLTHRRVRSLA